MTPQEFKTIFDEYRMLVFNFCNKMVNNRHDAEDITSKVFIQLWKREDITNDSIKAYLIINARHRCMDFLKSKRIYQHKLSQISKEEFDRIEIETEVLNHIYKLIDLLPKQQKAVLRLRFIENKKSGEIAKAMNLTPQNVYNTLQDALKRLRKEIKNRGIDGHGQIIAIGLTLLNQKSQ